MIDKNRIAVIGDGGWGTTLSILLSNKAFAVSLWGAFPEYVDILKNTRENPKFLPDIKIPKDINITPNIEEAAKGASIIVFAVPSQFAREVAQRLKVLNISESIVLSVTKGIETKSLKRTSEIIKEELGNVMIAVISGPTIAREVARQLPASVVAASSNEDIAKSVQDVFMNERFRVYTSTDVVGVELGGSFKNIIAIAAGISDGLGLGTNAKSALFTRGLVEMKRLGTALGAKEETFDGLSGMGDLMTTCISPYSRNRHVGEEIAKGKTLKEIISQTEQIAEGIQTTKSVLNLAKRHNVEMPITKQVYEVLFENKNPQEAVTDLMTRQKKAE